MEVRACGKKKGGPLGGTSTSSGREKCTSVAKGNEGDGSN